MEDAAKAGQAAGGKDMGALFASIQPGDMLTIPCNHGGENHTHDFAVLKVEPHNGRAKVWVSRPDDDNLHLFAPGINPLSWDESEKIILDRDGVPLPLETGDFQIERGAAMSAYQRHLALPQIRLPKAKVTEADLKTVFKETKAGDIFDQILYLAENGDLGNTGEIAEVALTNFGYEPTPALVAAVMGSARLLATIAEASRSTKVVSVVLTRGE